MSTSWIRVGYGVVLGLVLACTVATGVTLLLPGPKPVPSPEITFRQLASGSENERGAAQLPNVIDDFYKQVRAYRDDYVTWQRNVFLLASVLAAVLAIVGVALPASINYMRWGLLVGAGLTMAWVVWVATGPVPNPVPSGALLSFLAAGEPKQLDFAGRFLRFAVSFISLILLVFLGLWRLTDWGASEPMAVVPVTPAQPVARTTAPAAPVTAAATPVESRWAPPPADAQPPAPAWQPAPTAPSQPTVAVAEPPPAQAAPPPAPSTPYQPAPPPPEWQRPSGGTG